MYKLTQPRTKLFYKKLSNIKKNNQNLTQTVTKILKEVMLPTLNFFYEATSTWKSKPYEK